MSKYQEALNYLDWFCEKPHQEQQDLLQELIDKDKPTKPLINKRYCGKCHLVRLLPQENYCSHCGQKIDWSEEE